MPAVLQFIIVFNFNTRGYWGDNSDEPKSFVSPFPLNAKAKPPHPLGCGARQSESSCSARTAHRRHFQCESGVTGGDDAADSPRSVSIYED